MKVIFEPGQTPIDLSQDGTVEGEPGTQSDLQELANRFGLLVSEIYDQHLSASTVVEAWEVGNEPNLGYEYIPNNY